MRYAAARGAGRTALEPVTPGGHRDCIWGGSISRLEDLARWTGGPQYENAGYLDAEALHYAGLHCAERCAGLHGAGMGPHPSARGYIPLGYARRRAAGVDPRAYAYYQGERVAVPRGLEARALLHRIAEGGPQWAGYAREGDTLVPAHLGPGDRKALSQYAP